VDNPHKRNTDRAKGKELTVKHQYRGLPKRVLDLNLTFGIELPI